MAKTSCSTRWIFGVRARLVPDKSFILGVILFLSLFGRESLAQGVGIIDSTITITPSNSAVLELRSNTRAFLLPRLTGAPVGTAVNGLAYYNSTSNRIYLYNGSWLQIPVAGDYEVPLTFQNGLTRTTNTITLGGTLTQATTIDNGSYTITIGGASAGGTITIGSSSGSNTVAIASGSGTTTLTLANAQTGGSVSIGAAMQTGTINIGGNAQTAAITIGSALASSSSGNYVYVAGGNNTTAQSVFIANGAGTASSSVNILSGVGTNGVDTLNLANNPRVTVINMGNYTPSAARTTTIAGQTSGFVDLVNIGTGAATVAGGKTINIGNTAPTGAGTNIIQIGAVSTTNGNGMRFGNRLIRNFPTAPPTFGAASTLTATQVMDAGMCTVTASFTLTFPTLASFTTLMPSLGNGDVINFIIYPNGNWLTTVAAGTGGSVYYNPTTSLRYPRVLTIRFTGGPPATAYTIY